MLLDPAGSGDPLAAFSAPSPLTPPSPSEPEELDEDDGLAGDSAGPFPFRFDLAPFSPCSSSSSSSSPSSLPVFLAEEPSRRFRLFFSFRLRLW